MVKVYCSNCANFVESTDRYDHLVNSGAEIGAETKNLDARGKPWRNWCKVENEVSTFYTATLEHLAPEIKNEKNNCKDFKAK